MQDNKTLAALVTKALGYTENGGKPNLKNLQAGQSGEQKSIFQFEPGTWDTYSKSVFGKVLPLTPDNETHAVLQDSLAKLNKGYTPQQIASMHNAGIGEPNAYTGKFSNGESSSGTNKHGVAYNVKSYVDKFDKYLNSFGSGKDSEQTPTQPSAQPSNIPLQASTSPNTGSTPLKRGLLPNVPVTA